MDIPESNMANICLFAFVYLMAKEREREREIGKSYWYDNNNDDYDDDGWGRYPDEYCLQVKYNSMQACTQKIQKNKMPSCQWFCNSAMFILYRQDIERTTLQCDESEQMINLFLIHYELWFVVPAEIITSH